MLVAAPGPAARFVRFAVVGSIGYVANLAVFALLVRDAHVVYLAAASASFAAAVALNYLLNRAWTFRDARGAFLGQGAKFAAVSCVALGWNLLVLHLLVRSGLHELAAQGIAVALALPVNFAGNRLWASRSAHAAVPSGLAPALARFRASERAAAYRTVALWWVGSRALVLATAAVVQALQWPRASWYPSLAQHPFALLGAWDGRWYRMVAERGYLSIPHHQSDVAFFPLFPILLGVLRRAGLSLDTGGLLLANLGLLVGLVALYELARTWLPEQAALRTAVYAAIFPMGYVFSMVYPEAIVLAAMALAGVLAARGRWRGAAVAAAVGGLARPEAIFLVVPLLALAVRGWRALGDRERRRALVAVGAAPAAVAGVALYDWRTFGDALAFSSAQRAWGRWFSPDGVARAVHELARAPGTENVWLFRDAGFCLLYVLLLLIALRAGVPAGWVIAGGLIVLLPLETGSFTSDGRFGLLALPVYAGLAAAARRAWLDRLVRGGSVALLVAASATILMRWP